ncbi:gag-pol polyprotein [Tanacetum coccineum]|uniref:Gag-pol polyprotein n=1 Tax=Tanacetum coccineum TaxID=301880 RepID=A0ABQ5F6Q1_9ASTR
MCFQFLVLISNPLHPVPTISLLLLQLTPSIRLVCTSSSFPCVYSKSFTPLLPAFLLQLVANPLQLKHYPSLCTTDCLLVVLAPATALRLRSSKAVSGSLSSSRQLRLTCKWFDPEQSFEDKEMQKEFGIPCKYSRSSTYYNNNLRTSSNSRNKTEDTTPRYNNDNQSRQFGNQRTMTVAGARETVGSQVVQQTGIQCFNCKGYGHYAKECRKPKRVKDYSYHKEKMMMCKQAEQGVQLQAEQADWLEDTDEEIDEQELEAHYSFMAKIQEVLPEESSSTDQPLEQVQNNDENNVFANERRHSEQPESINDTYVLEKDDSNVTPDSSNICNNDL